MSVPVLTFFNSNGGVGKTSLVYHLTWMLSKIGQRVLACDLDPQANLTATFLEEDEVQSIWQTRRSRFTMYQCVSSLTELGGLETPILRTITPELGLIPGDLALARFEDTLAAEWTNALGSNNFFRPLRVLTAFSAIMQESAQAMGASLILADVGPNLGAINRSALIATDKVLVPLGADLFSLQGLRHLGPTLRQWRAGWKSRREKCNDEELVLPNGTMEPIGYVVRQYSIRLNRPVKAIDKWVNRMPEAYAKDLLGKGQRSYPLMPSQDEHCLSVIRHYRSLAPMAKEARKPIFNLTTADGAIGSHAAAVADAYDDFRKLAEEICRRVGLPSGYGDNAEYNRP